MIFASFSKTYIRNKASLKSLSCQFSPLLIFLLSRLALYVVLPGDQPGDTLASQWVNIVACPDSQYKEPKVRTQRKRANLANPVHLMPF
ncbi:Uncharacterized protein HZ326_13900 [Fusarium oxysporum f. sp. albedinis]|nr:Uncharacterized protein HZ326_13900 [Fusarium oxysporum f. sp. albedinis]